MAFDFFGTCPTVPLAKTNEPTDDGFVGEFVVVFFVGEVCSKNGGDKKREWNIKNIYIYIYIVFRF